MSEFWGCTCRVTSLRLKSAMNDFVCIHHNRSCFETNAYRLLCTYSVFHIQERINTHPQQSTMAIALVKKVNPYLSKTFFIVSVHASFQTSTCLPVCIHVPIFIYVFCCCLFYRCKPFWRVCRKWAWVWRSQTCWSRSLCLAWITAASIASGRRKSGKMIISLCNNGHWSVLLMTS